ncbi:MAG TPA: hypothetical protein VGH90_13045 [Chthoniobacteraceae bacterium]
MSTVAEIEKAIDELPKNDREALESRLILRRFGLAALEQDERAELLTSLDAADMEIDTGSMHTAAELREALRSCVGK